MASLDAVILIIMLMISPCLSANIAQDKPAYQTGTGGGLVAGQAVDGKKDNKTDPEYYKTTCTQPSILPGVAQWWVDLEGTYIVDNVAVFNTYDFNLSTTMNHFYVDVVEEDGNKHKCGSYNEDNPIPPGGSITVSCNTRGRYVFITKLSGHIDQGLITICEVRVDGSFMAAARKPIIKPTTYRYRPITVPAPTVPLGPPTDIPLIGKSTNQTGAYDGWTSDRAVDGLYLGNGGSTGNKGNCAHPENPTGQAAEWWVDLGKMYKITSITVYNTDTRGGYYRLDNFAFRAYSPGVQTPLTCATFPGRVGHGASETLTCADNVYGQYIQFIRLGGREIHWVTLCEVKITGQDYSGCPAGYYGDDCDLTCGNCVTKPDVYNPCDQTGRCVIGCQMWWAPDTCHTEISEIHRRDETVTATQTANTIEVKLQQISVPPDLSEYYGYMVSYGMNLRYIPVSGTDINIFTLTGLDYDTEYTITIKPYRVKGTKYDYGTGYPPQTIRTQSAPHSTPTSTTEPTQTTTPTTVPASDQSSGAAVVIPWALFAAAFAINLMFIGIVIYMCRLKNGQTGKESYKQKHANAHALSDIRHEGNQSTDNILDSGGYEEVNQTRTASEVGARMPRGQSVTSTADGNYSGLHDRVPDYENTAPYDVIA